jgi:hypothetical protein
MKLKKDITAILLLAIFCAFGVTGCTSERIQAIAPPQPMSRDVERQHIQDEGIEFCKRYPDDVACRRKAQ